MPTYPIYAAGMRRVRPSISAVQVLRDGENAQIRYHRRCAILAGRSRPQRNATTLIRVLVRVHAQTAATPSSKLAFMGVCATRAPSSPLQPTMLPRRTAVTATEKLIAATNVTMPKMETVSRGRAPVVHPARVVGPARVANLARRPDARRPTGQRGDQAVASNRASDFCVKRYRLLSHRRTHRQTDRQAM